VADAQRYVAERSPALLASLAARAADDHTNLEVVSDLLTGDAFLVASRPGTSAAVLLHQSTGMRKVLCGSAQGDWLGVVDGARVAVLIVDHP
jgi:hypothetical protein